MRYILLFIFLLANTVQAQETWVIVRPDIKEWRGKNDFFFRLFLANINDLYKRAKNNDPKLRRVEESINQSPVLKPKAEINYHDVYFTFKADPFRANIEFNADIESIKFKTQGTFNEVYSGVFFNGFYIKYVINQGLRIGYGASW